MIVAETADRYRFVTQPDHADLAGQFAEHWGNDDVDGPHPYASVVAAAHTHDTGWTSYDRHPRLGDDGEPIDFREMPADAWIDLYDDGIEAVVEMDAYAGLLVSMHGAGLRSRRYGLSPEWPSTPAPYREFVDREEERQRTLAGRIREGGGPVSDADDAVLSDLHESGRGGGGRGSRLWANYRRLQAWDALSLAFCVTTSPPGYDEIDAVPVASASSVTDRSDLAEVTDTTISIDRGGGDEFRLDSYPFDRSPLRASVPARTVEKDAFDDEEGLALAYYAAGRETIEITLRPDDR